MLGTSCYQVTRLMKLTKLQKIVPTCLLTLSTLLQDDKGPFIKDVRAKAGEREVWKISTNSDIGGQGGF
jgi:hypothetical protein